MKDNATILQMEQEVGEMTSLHYLTKENAVFSRTEGGFVRLQYDDKVWEDNSLSESV